MKLYKKYKQRYTQDVKNLIRDFQNNRGIFRVRNFHYLEDAAFTLETEGIDISIDESTPSDVRDRILAEYTLSHYFYNLQLDTIFIAMEFILEYPGKLKHLGSMETLIEEVTHNYSQRGHRYFKDNLLLKDVLEVIKTIDLDTL